MTKNHIPAEIAVGDRLIVHAHHLGEHPRDAEILEVRGEHGPYRVRWDDGSETLLYPGSDVSIEHFRAPH